MNTSSSYTILVTGLGALGTVFATLLKKAGCSVFALTKDKYLPAHSNRRVRVTGIWGEHEAALDGIYSSIDPLRKRKIDIIILTVKSYDTAAAIAQVKPLVGEHTLVITAQNGYGNYEIVSTVVGKERTLLARIIFGVKLHAPGQAEVTVIADDVRIGQPHGAVDRNRVQKVAVVLTAAGIPTSYAENVYAILWDKILYNAALNPLGAVLECTYGQLAENAETRQIMNSIIDEIFRVAKAHGMPLNWKSAEEYLKHFYTNLVPSTSKHFPSMYYDVKAFKRLEIDALNGAIVMLARDMGIRVPVNETITGLLRAKEALTAAAKISCQS
ncbi:MAG TPA: 2-dehydropantoate 2-reductase [Nitrospirota bacterium]|nr:2-dehydropantoate 2-reductase [Nitrospirota bacterium]